MLKRKTAYPSITAPNNKIYTKDDVTGTLFMPDVGGNHIASFIGFLSERKTLMEPYLVTRCQLGLHKSESGQAYEVRIMNWILSCENEIGPMSDGDRQYIAFVVEAELMALQHRALSCGG